MHFKHLIIVCLCALCVSTYAQRETTLVDLQSNDTAFFDPNKKKVEEPYHFAVHYRIEAGYNQNWQRSQDSTFADLYLHGARVGVAFDFILPHHLSVQTGLYYTLVYGRQTQKWGVMSFEDSYAQGYTIRHRVLEHNLTVPVRAYYTIPLWKQLNLFFYTGPQLQIGVAERDYLQNFMTDRASAWLQELGGHTTPYDRFTEKELWRANIQWGLGGGLEWDKHRLVAGYDFGLNNLVRTPIGNGQKMSEWGWHVTYSYKL